MDVKKEALGATENVAEVATMGAKKVSSFLKSSLLRSLVLVSLLLTGFLLVTIWNTVYANVSANDSFETFISTSIALMSSPLLLIALYYYFESFAQLLKKIGKLSLEDKAKHRKNLIIAAVAASLAGWAVKLFFLPAVAYFILTVYMLKLISNKKK